jgi:hypothetical protein
MTAPWWQPSDRVGSEVDHVRRPASEERSTCCYSGGKRLSFSATFARTASVMSILS